MVNVKVVGFLIYVVFGLFLINKGVSFVTIPEAVLGFEKWIFIIAGFLIIVGGFIFLKAGKKLRSQ